MPGVVDEEKKKKKTRHTYFMRATAGLCAANRAYVTPGNSPALLEIVMGRVYINLGLQNDDGTLHMLDIAACRVMIISDRWLQFFEELA